MNILKKYGPSAIPVTQWMMASPPNESCVLKDCGVCLRSKPAAAGPLYVRNPSDNMRQKHTQTGIHTHIHRNIRTHRLCVTDTEINVHQL